MKSFVVLSCVLVTAYAVSPEVLDQIRQKVTQAGQECKAEVGASDDDLAMVKSYQSPATQTGKCLIACMSKKFGFMDEAGKIDKETTYMIIEKVKAVDADISGNMKKVADACFAEVMDAEDECETADNMYACMQKQNKALGIKPIDV